MQALQLVTANRKQVMNVEYCMERLKAVINTVYKLITINLVCHRT